VNSVVDNSLVGLALLASAAYAVTSLGPKSLRGRVLGGLSRAAARAPRFPGMRGLAQRLAAASAKASAACGGCESCGSDKAPAPDVRVPLSKIGRRESKGR
jgi:hypothetical protein